MVVLLLMNIKKEVSGFRHSKAWATDQRLFYYIQFSHPVKEWERLYEASPTKESFEFINPNNEPVLIKIGICFSTKGCRVGG